MHRLGRHKKLFKSYARTAIIAVLFMLVAIPFVSKVENGGQTYTPDDRYMVVLNGEKLGYVSDASMVNQALKDARAQINGLKGGMTLVESDISVYKEQSSGDVISSEILTESIYNTLTSTAVDTKDTEVAYTVRIDDFTVTLASQKEVVELFQSVKDKYASANEFTVELVEDSNGAYTSLKTNIVSADVEINEAAKVLATMSGTGVSVKDEDIVYKDGVLSVGFAENVEIIETKANKDNIVSVEEAYELITKEHAEKGTYTVVAGDCLSAIAKKHDLTLDELFSLNYGMDVNTAIYPGETIIVTVPASEITVLVVEELSYDEEYKAPVQYVDNNKLYTGTENIIQQGISGQRGVVALVSYVNGVESGREIISQTVYKEAVPTIIERGTLTPPTYIKPVNSNYVTSHFGYRDHPITHEWKLHTGVDWNAPMNTPVKASSSGVVVRASWFGAYGYCVDIQHVDGSLTRYAHLNSFAVQYGQTVRQGQLIAYSGNTGASTGPHLHFELHLRGNLVNPLDYVGK